jgi:transcription elongation factor GreA
MGMGHNLIIQEETMKKLFKLTQDGIDELRIEMEKLISERSAITERIRSARELGDLSENAEYASARSEQERNENRINDIDHILLNVELIKAPKNGKLVGLGSTVSLSGGSKTKKFQIVGTVEADPMNGKISDESPIGKALIGKKVGEKVEIVTPAETSFYTIDSIS